jgi:hypothetical protein
LLASAITPTIYYSGLSGAAFIPFPIDLINHLINHYGGDDLLQKLKPWFHLADPINLVSAAWREMKTATVLA